MAMRWPMRVKVTTSTTGTGTYTVTETPQAGYRTLSQATLDHDLNDGDTVAYIVVDTTVVNNSTGKLLEAGTGVWSNSAKTVTRASVLQPNAGAVNWGAATRDFLIIDNPALYAAIANNLSEMNAASCRGNLGLGTAALATIGTGSGNVPELDSGGQIPLSMLGHASGAEFISGTHLAFADDVVPSNGRWTQITGIDDAVFMSTSGSGHGGATGGVYTSNASGDNSWQVSWALGVGGHSLVTSEQQGWSAVNVTPGAGATVNSSTPAATAGTAHTHPITDSKTWRPPCLTQCVGVHV
jgi:hypothetical protein